MRDQAIRLSAAYMAEQSLPLLRRYAFICQWQLHNPETSSWLIRKQVYHITENDTSLYQLEETHIAGKSIQIQPTDCFIIRKGIILPSPFAQLSLALSLQNRDTGMVIEKSALLMLNFDSRLIQ